MGQISLRNAAAVINHLDNRLFSFGTAADIHVLPVFSVAHGIGQEVLKYPGQQFPVSLNLQQRGQLQAGGQPVIVQQRVHFLIQLVQQLA
ncbi:hypothetical protein D3C73_1179270 [compost metagenome]